MNMMILLLYIGILAQTINGMMIGLCGPTLDTYNFDTHGCVDQVVVIKDRIFVCGIPPIQINLNTHVCRGGIKVPINKISTRKPKPSTPPPVPPSSTSIDNRIPRHICPSDNLPEGDACCVDQAYRPAEQTCCIITGSYYEVLEGAERDHVCCTVGDTMRSKLYKRGSLHIPCQHASSNNKLFGKGLSLKQAGSTTCHKFSHVFKFEINRQKITADKSEFGIKIKGWENLSNLEKRRRPRWRRIQNKYIYSSNMWAKLDKYIPKKGKYILRKDLRLKKKCFLVFTNKNYYEDAVFFLKKDEILFKCPKKRQSIKNILRKINKNC